MGRGTGREGERHGGRAVGTRWALSAVVLVGAVALAGCSTSSLYVINADGTGKLRLTDTGANGAVWSPDGTRIAFARNGEIRVINPDGTGEVNLTKGRVLSEQSLAWSPDGTRIAFASGGDSYVVNADGSSLVRLTHTDLQYSRAEWSPDGTWIAVTSWDSHKIVSYFLIHPDGTGERSLPGFPVWSPDGKRIAVGKRGEIHVMNPDGTGEVNLTKGSYPSWSPDGTRIAFMRSIERPQADPYQHEDWDIWVVGADGSEPVNLTGARGHDEAPIWSPDGTRIAFERTHDEPEAVKDIYVVNADGSGLANLTNSPASEDDYPAWSPDGTHIAFTRLIERPHAGPVDPSDWDMWVVGADGSKPVNLAGPRGDDKGPFWSPDGNRFAFVSDRTGNWDIYVVNADGSGLANLTNAPGVDSVDSWSPDGTKIAFWDSGGGSGGEAAIQWGLVLVLLMILALAAAFSIWGIVDAALRPAAVWASAGHSKALWIVVQLFLGSIGAAIYFLTVRPKLMSARRSVVNVASGRRSVLEGGAHKSR